MKPKLLLALIICCLFMQTTYAQNPSAAKLAKANAQLSNLVAPTAVNITLAPGIADSLSLGSKAFKWKNLNIDNVVFADKSIQTTAFIPYTAGTGIMITGHTISSSNSGGWSLTGNAGTNPSTNFIGTTDAKSLVFKVNNTQAGLIDYSTYNTGTRNTAFGEIALYFNTSGMENTATGYGTLYSNTTGNDNSALGKYALFTNNQGSYNTALGYNAMFFNTSGVSNTAIGSNALQNNTIGSNNTANGFEALFNNTTGYSNVAIGTHALYNNTDQDNLVAIGDSALYNNGDGFSNMAIGSKALYSNTTGYENTADGNQSLYLNTTGVGNTANGFYALHYNTTGIGNTAIGYQALYSNSTGGYNTVVGTGADVNADGYSKSAAFGAYATITASNQVRIGDGDVTSIGGYANWTNISDGRVKQNIKQNVPGLAFINKLQPITYNLDLDAADRIVQRPQIKDKDGKAIQPSQIELAARKAKEQITYTGFIAQDVEAAAKSLNYDFSGVDAAKNSKDLYGLRYAEFVVPLVKGEQELSAENDSLRANNISLQSQINELKTMVQLLASKSGVALPSNSISLSSASIEQNIPNPFKGTTTISYTLPQQYNSAQIIITDNNGHTLKTMNVSGNGKGTLNVDASTLSSGAYSYSLLIDGKLISTKQMVLAK